MRTKLTPETLRQLHADDRLYSLYLNTFVIVGYGGWDEHNQRLPIHNDRESCDIAWYTYLTESNVRQEGWYLITSR